MNDVTSRCVVVFNKFLACIYVQLRVSWERERKSERERKRDESFYISRARFIRYVRQLHLVYVYKIYREIIVITIGRHYLRLMYNIYDRIMHSCTLGICHVTCNRLYWCIGGGCRQIFSFSVLLIFLLPWKNDAKAREIFFLIR